MNSFTMAPLGHNGGPKMDTVNTTDTVDIQESIQIYLKKDPWIDTEIENYVYLNPLQQGTVVGEPYVSNYMMNKFNSEVLSADCGPKGPYGRIIDGHKTEIKFSAAHSCNNGSVATIIRTKQIDPFFQQGEVNWTINHVSEDKSWERLIFCGIDLVDGVIVPKVVWCTKEDFLTCLLETKKTMWGIQQGGEKGNNDDYMNGGSKTRKWIDSEFTRDIETWNDEVKQTKNNFQKMIREISNAA